MGSTLAAARKSINIYVGELQQIDIVSLEQTGKAARHVRRGLHRALYVICHAVLGTAKG